MGLKKYLYLIKYLYFIKNTIFVKTVQIIGWSLTWIIAEIEKSILKF